MTAFYLALTSNLIRWAPLPLSVFGGNKAWVNHALFKPMSDFLRPTSIPFEPPQELVEFMESDSDKYPRPEHWPDDDVSCVDDFYEVNDATPRK